MNEFEELIYVVCDKKNIGARSFVPLIKVFDCKEWREAVASNSCSHLYLIATTYDEFLSLPNAEVLSYRWSDTIKIKCSVLAPGATGPSEVTEAEISLDIFRKIRATTNSLLWIDYLSHLNHPVHKKSVICNMGSLYIKGSVFPLYMQDFITPPHLQDRFAAYPGHEFLSLFADRKTGDLSEEDIRVIVEKIKAKPRRIGHYWTPLIGLCNVLSLSFLTSSLQSATGLFVAAKKEEFGENSRKKVPVRLTLQSSSDDSDERVSLMRDTLTKKCNIQSSNFEAVIGTLALTLPRDFNASQFAWNLGVQLELLPKNSPLNIRNEEYSCFVEFIEGIIDKVTDEFPERIFSLALRRGWIQQEVTFGQLQHTVVRDFVYSCVQREEYSALGTLIRRRPRAMHWVFGRYEQLKKLIEDEEKHKKDEEIIMKDRLIRGFNPAEIAYPKDKTLNFRGLLNLLECNIFNCSPSLDTPNMTADNFINHIINHRLINKEEFRDELVTKICERSAFDPTDLFCSQSLLRAFAESELTYEQDAYFAMVQCPALLCGLSPDDVLRACWRTILTSGTTLSFRINRKSKLDWTLGLPELLPFMHRALSIRGNKYLILHTDAAHKLHQALADDEGKAVKEYAVLIYDFDFGFLFDTPDDTTDDTPKCVYVNVTNSATYNSLLERAATEVKDKLKKCAVKCNVEFPADSNGLRMHNFHAETDGGFYNNV